MSARVVVGLGNPGAEYESTRHNIGWRVLDEFAGRGANWQDKPKLEATVATTPDVILAKPQTYMNESGRSVAKLADYYKRAPGTVLIVCDDINLPFGTLRYRASGSAGGQKGLADIIHVLGTEAVPRLRVGVGPPPPGRTATEFVLSRFSAEETEQLPALIKKAAAELGERL